MTQWELSSAGSEHLPYKQGANGSNPLVPTEALTKVGAFFLSVSVALFQPINKEIGPRADSLMIL